MPRMPARIAWFLLCCACAAPATQAQSGESPYESGDFDVEQADRVWLRALLDVRLVRAGPAPSWTDAGAGKLRYGGKVVQTPTGPQFERVTRFTLSQLAFELGATLPGDIRAQAQVNFEPDIADSMKPWIIEAVLRKEWGSPGSGWGLQGGVMNLPFSLEHVGAAWSPDFGLSASALNSWLWEDASLAGLDGEWWHQTETVRLGALIGAGYGPDRMARLLALRGWAIGDGISGINSDLPLPNGTRMDIYDERDHRPALYTWLTLSDKREIAALKLGYFDNRGDQNVDGVWHTKFSVVGLELRPLARIEFLAQYLDGTARVAAPANDSDLKAWYGLLSWHHNRHRVSVRYDSFHIRDLDGGPLTQDNGDGVTVSWQFQWKLRHRVAFEHTWLNSRRPASGVANPTPDGTQLSYRFRY
jgi:hypothetical protein